MASGPVGAPVAVQPPSAGLLVAGSGRDPQTAFLAARVKQLACLSFWLQSCCGLVFVAFILFVACSIPSGVDYDKFREMCRDGELSAASCQQLEHQLSEFCAARHLDAEACANYVSRYQLGGIKEVLFMLAAAIVISLFCWNLVPLCGYCGARHNSQFLVSCFMVFNLVFAVLYVPHVWQEGFRSLAVRPFMVSFVLPCLSFAYALALRKQQGQPQVLAVPLLQPHASQPVYPQPAQTLYQQQGWQQEQPPQAFYAPQQQQPQAYYEPSQPQSYYPPMQFQEPLPPQDQGRDFAPSAPPHDDCGY